MIRFRLMVVFVWWAIFTALAQDVRPLKDSLPDLTGKEKAQMLLKIANYYYPSTTDSALLYVNRALKAYRQAGDKKGEASCWGLAGAIYGSYGMYDTAVALLFKVIDWGRPTDNVRVYISWLNLANIYEELGQLDKAKQFYHNALNGSYLPARRAALANLGVLMMKEKKLDSAAACFNNALTSYLSDDTTLPINLYNMGTLYLNLAGVELQKQNYILSLKKLDNALRLFQKIKDKESVAKVFLKKGEVYKQMGKTEPALRFFQKAKVIAEQSNVPSLQEKVLLSLTKFYASQKDYKRAYEYLIAYEKVHDSLMVAGYKTTIAEKEVRYKLSEKVNKITALQKEKRILFATSAALVLGLLLISAVIILILNYRRLKHKQEKAVADAKSYVARMKAQKAEEELRAIKKDLQEKSALIQELQEEFKQLVSQDDEQKIDEKISLLRKTKILTNDDWNRYMNLFNEIYPGFTKHLFGKKELTEGDKRQLVFLKLGLKQNEIASLMGISTEGVKRARQRLAKKLGLGSTLELNDFISRY